MDILQSKFPESGISDETFVSVVSPTYFSNLSNMISSSERRFVVCSSSSNSIASLVFHREIDKTTNSYVLCLFVRRLSCSGLNDYFMWKMAEAYVPYLSVKFREIVKIYQTELTGEKDLPPRWETCVTLLQKYMGFGVAASLEPYVDNKDAVVSSVNGIFDAVKETIRSKVDENKDLGLEMREHVLGKVKPKRQCRVAVRHRPVFIRPEYRLFQLDSLTVQVGLPDNMLQESYVNQFYSQMSIQKLDFFLNINHAVSYINDYSQVKLKLSKEEFR